jgi:large repetitive protein
VVFTGLSPNGDGMNDGWTILGIDLFNSNEVMVFNRWGNQVYHKKGYNNFSKWEGKFESTDLPDGTYFYIIDLGDGSEKLSGYLQISR